MITLQPPPPPAAPAEQVLRSDVSYLMAASQDIPLRLARAKQTEWAVARYTLYVKSDTRLVQPAEATASEDCRWLLTAHLQRQLCFTSITGAFACSDPTVADLPDKDSGHVVGPAPLVDACAVNEAALATAKRQFNEAAAKVSPARFDGDLKLSLIPLLRKTGVTVQTPKPQELAHARQ